MFGNVYIYIPGKEDLYENVQKDFRVRIGAGFVA